MKRMLVGFVVLALLMVVECSAGGNKSTNKGTTFSVFCTFDSGDFLNSSTITIDTTHGSVLSADLYLYSPFSGEEGYFYAPSVSTNAAGDVEITFSGWYDDLGEFPAELVLTLPVTSLKNYAGGDIIASDSYWEYWDGSWSSGPDYLDNGYIVSQ